MRKPQSPQLIIAKDPDVEFAIFLEELREYERAFLIEEAQNAFLDAYSAWRNTSDLAMHPAPCCSALRTRDPSGQCHCPSACEYRRWLVVERCGVKAQMILCAAYLAFLDPTFQGPRALRRYYTVSRE
jgi:hypothetical protein